MSDFVQNLVRRAAGLAGPVTIRPPFQPYFEPSLTLAPGPALPKHLPASLQAARRAPTQMEASVTAQPAPPRLAPKTVEPSPELALPVETALPVDLPAQRQVDGGLTHESPTESRPGVSTVSSPPSAPESERGPVQRIHHRVADAIQRSTPPAPLAQPQPIGQGQAADGEPMVSILSHEMDTVEASEVSRAQPRLEQIQESLSGVQPRPDRPPVAQPSPELVTVHLPKLTVEPVVQPEVAPVGVKGEMRQATSIEPESPLPVEPRLSDASERVVVPTLVRPLMVPSPAQPVAAQPDERAPQLVRPAPAPPPPDIPPAVAPLHQAALPDTAPSVEVRIGTVEVRASRPAPSQPPPPAPQPQGFDDYAYLRG